MAESTAAINEKNETDEVVIATYRDAIQGSGDAYYCWEGTFVWEALTVNNGGVIEPWLAESWEHNDDCTEWTLHLRQDAYFTDGVQFNADVCLANIDRWGKDLTSTYTSLSIEKTFPNLDTLEKVDDFTIKCTFTEPLTTLEYNLSDYGSPMFSPNCFDEETGVISDYAIGTGPYKIIDHKENEYVLLERNDDYYGTPGNVKTFRIRCIPEAETRISALKSGEVMGLADNGAITMDAAQDLCNTDPNFAMDITPSHMVEYITFNCQNEYLSDSRLRNAVSLATDRDSICEVLYGGLLEPAYSYLSNQSVFHLDIQGEYDMEKAKELAAEVLGDQTVDMNMIIRSNTASDYNCKAVAEYMKQVYAEIGLNIEIEILDSNIYKERQAEGDFDMALTVSGLNNADPASTFKAYFTSDGTSNKQYGLNYYNPEIDELVEKATTIADVDERGEIYDQIQTILYEDMAVCPICYQVNVNIHNVAIENYAGRTFGVGLPTISWTE
ncbi:ABC transporter, substrate-binding protein, family 5 [Marvinbryantia formatexigens DSM 14469]|uniref:ABC transporter, substrate-binding protein, family 5 n=2 Tax=Marvinbryantia TaxID=248744 RepID=C6LB16_9FIRM|nr:ABC transporter, substrate-binding protein, family 5 [Marvinbryantia formatexigens DSM 14469]